MPALSNAAAVLTATNVVPAVSIGSTNTSAAVDLQGYEGIVTFVWNSGATSGTLDPKLTDCATSGGSYADITGATAAQIATANQIRTISVDVRAVKRYIKTVSTYGTGATVASVTMIGYKKVTG